MLLSIFFGTVTGLKLIGLLAILVAGLSSYALARYFLGYTRWGAFFCGLAVDGRHGPVQRRAVRAGAGGPVLAGHGRPVGRDGTDRRLGSPGRGDQKARNGVAEAAEAGEPSRRILTTRG